MEAIFQVVTSNSPSWTRRVTGYQLRVSRRDVPMPTMHTSTYHLRTVPQMPQTAYRALQAPYSFFGLGRTNNYIEVSCRYNAGYRGM
jgi:hypothetical protein